MLVVLGEEDGRGIGEEKGGSSQKDTMHFALWSASGSLSERWAKHCEMTFPPVNVMVETSL